MQNSSVIQKLTAGELAQAETLAGLSIASLEDPNFPKVKLLAALGYVWEKRNDATLKYKDYMDSHTLEEITESLGLSDEDDSDEEE